MKTSIIWLGTGLLSLGVSLNAPQAKAQESGYKPELPAPTNTYEVKIGVGYTQGLGHIAPGTPVVNVAGAGIGFGVDVDRRFSPNGSLGLEAQYQEFSAQNNTGARGLAVNLGATYHTTPEQRSDAWVRLGTGYRFLWDVSPTHAPNTTNMFHGFDIATAKIGYDIRANRSIAFAPVVGADLQSFIWADATPLSSAQFGTFIYGGLQGRLDGDGSSERDLSAQR